MDLPKQTTNSIGSNVKKNIERRLYDDSVRNLTSSRLL